MNAKPLVIVGAGGFGRELVAIAGWIDPIGLCGLAGVADDGQVDEQLVRQTGTAYLGSTSEVLDTFGSDARFIVGVGDGTSRAELHSVFTAAGWEPCSLIHPDVQMGPLVSVGEGTALCGGTTITTNVSIGVACQINLNCTIGHDCTFGEFVTLSPGVNVSGNVKIGDRATLYSNSVIGPGVNVGSNAIVGAGAVVIRDVEPGSVVVGNPARPKQPS